MIGIMVNHKETFRKKLEVIVEEESESIVQK